MKQAFAFTIVLTLLACSPAPAQQAGPPADNQPAARVGDHTITVADLDARWRKENAPQQAEVVRALYEGRRAALDDIVADMAIAEAARAKSMTPEAYETAELATRLQPVTDAQVSAFYEGNKSQMQGRSLDEMKPLIRDFLEQQHRAEARQQLVTELRKNGPPVRVLLAAPRVEVAIAPTDPVKGKANARVTIVEFSDFQCPYCQRVLPTLRRVEEAYGDQVRVVWKDFPLTQVHPQAFKAAEAAHCAEDQGKFWAYHDRLFADQQALQPEALKASAASLGLDTKQFEACLDSSKYAERVRAGQAEGSRVGVRSTPTFFINGREVGGAQPYEVFATIIDEELAK